MSEFIKIQDLNKKIWEETSFKRCEFNFTWWTDCGFTWT